MKKNTLLKCYIATGAVVAVPTLYFIVRLIVDATTNAYLSQIWTTLNYVAIGLYGLALLMLVAIVVGSVIIEKKTPAKVAKIEDEKEKLSKYQSKKAK